MTDFLDLAVQGEMIDKMPEGTRWAKIIAPAPEYENTPTKEEPDKKKVKIHVELSNGSKAVYYPNMTSARKIAASISTDMTKWINAVIVWVKIRDMDVAGQEKKVLFVTEVRI
jgi:hypothetical protein